MEGLQATRRLRLREEGSRGGVKGALFLNLRETLEVYTVWF